MSFCDSELFPLLADSLPGYSSRTSINRSTVEKKQDYCVCNPATRRRKTNTSGRTISKRWQSDFEHSTGLEDTKYYQARYQVISPSGHHDIQQRMFSDRSRICINVHPPYLPGPRLPLRNRIALWLRDVLFSSRHKLYFLQLAPDGADDETKKKMAQLVVLYKRHKHKDRLYGVGMQEMQKTDEFLMKNLLDDVLAAKELTERAFKDTWGVALQLLTVSEDTTKTKIKYHDTKETLQDEKLEQNTENTVRDEDAQQAVQPRESMIAQMLYEQIDRYQDACRTLEKSTTELAKSIAFNIDEIIADSCTVSQTKLIQEFNTFACAWLKIECERAGFSAPPAAMDDFYTKYFLPTLKKQEAPPFSSSSCWYSVHSVRSEVLYKELGLQLPGRVLL